MIISSINPANTKIGFGTTQAQETKAKEQPTFIYGATELPEGYHWEHDLDHDTFVAVKNGYTYDEDKFTAVPVGKPYLPNLVETKKINPATTDSDVVKSPDDIRNPEKVITLNMI